MKQPSELVFEVADIQAALAWYCRDGRTTAAHADRGAALFELDDVSVALVLRDGRGGVRRR